MGKIDMSKYDTSKFDPERITVFRLSDGKPLYSFPGYCRWVLWGLGWAFPVLMLGLAASQVILMML